jgi:hypothetical protein
LNRNENIYDLLNDYLEIDGDSINVLEEQIDSDIQMEYFECVKSNQDENGVSEVEVIKNKDKIFDPEIPIDQKKIILVQLASVNNVEAYRTIESYLKKPNIKLFEWAYMALQESRILLESKFLEENRVLITTGLGGRGNKLRYFIVFLTEDGTPFTTLQQNIMNSELSYLFKKYGAEIEDILFEKNFALVLSMVPLSVPVQKLFDKVLKECNEFGDFLFNDYIITNVKILTLDEIHELLAINNTF